MKNKPATSPTWFFKAFEAKGLFTLVAEMEPLLSSAAYGLLWDQKSRFIKRNTCENASAAYIRACVSERSTALWLCLHSNGRSRHLCPLRGGRRDIAFQKQCSFKTCVGTLRDPAEVFLGRKTLYFVCA